MSSSDLNARIVIVDDHPMMRDGMTMKIATQQGLQVCGEAASEDEGFDLIIQSIPDLVIIDVSLSTGNGINLVKRVHELNPSIRMLVVSTFEESVYAERALRAGALGYLNKQESNERLIEAIRVVMSGERFVSPKITKRLLDQALNYDTDTQSPVDQLTDRELEVFRLIGKGMKSGQVASQLYLSTHTVDTHRENIKRKLGVKTAAELNRQAIQWALENA